MTLQGNPFQARLPPAFSLNEFKYRSARTASSSFSASRSIRHLRTHNYNAVSWGTLRSYSLAATPSGDNRSRLNNAFLLEGFSRFHCCFAALSPMLASLCSEAFLYLLLIALPRSGMNSFTTL